MSTPSESSPGSADTPLPQFSPKPGLEPDTEPAREKSAGRVAPHLGWVHSHENASTVDGPGFRYVVWLAGCHLRCQYCHNPDTWAVNHGQRQSVQEIVDDAKRFADFLRTTGGGFTVSGGEPLVQAPFALDLLRRVKDQLGLPTALDTNGYLGDRLTDDDLDAVDLMLLDLKAFDAQRHHRVTGFDNADILTFARRLAERGRPTWVRYVLVPGLTDGEEDMRALAEFVAPMANVERVEVLPFHQMGRPKWHELGLTYPLDTTPSATAEQADAARGVFRAAGCVVA